MTSQTTATRRYIIWGKDASRAAVHQHIASNNSIPAYWPDGATSPETAADIMLAHLEGRCDNEGSGRMRGITVLPADAPKYRIIPSLCGPVKVYDWEGRYDCRRI